MEKIIPSNTRVRTHVNEKFSFYQQTKFCARSQTHE